MSSCVRRRRTFVFPSRGDECRAAGPRAAGRLREAKRGGTRSRRRNLRQTARFWRLRDGIPPRAPPSASSSEIPLIACSTLASSETTAGSTSKEERSRLCMAPAARPLSSLSGAERAVASSHAIVDSPMVLASAMPPVSCESICRVTTVRTEGREPCRLGVVRPFTAVKFRRQ